MANATAFRAEVPGGQLAGEVTGDGPPVLYLHGGPGIRYDTMDLLALDELSADYRVAIFQQRGLEPSTTHGPFTMAQAIDDVLAVIDALGWSQVFLVGHSWGAHLAFRVAAAHPDHLLGMLAVDGLGVVGDGGRETFETEMRARMPREKRERFDVLTERERAGRLSPQEEAEAQELLWPSFFGDPGEVAPAPSFAACAEATAGLTSELGVGVDEVVAALGRGLVRYGVLAGAAGPVPWGQAARANAELSPAAFLQVIPQAGHFVWYEAPGSLLGALRRLRGGG